ncbi:MAG: putative lipid II flippase FtsW [Polyangiales bacterium]
MKALQDKQSRLAVAADGPSPASLSSVRGSARLLAGLAVTLVGFGVVMVYSASAVWAHQRFGNGQYFLVRQASYAVLGLLLMAFVSRLPLTRLRQLTYPALVAALLALVAVALGLGHHAGGATRWLTLGPVHVQPAELAKLALVLWLCDSLSRKRARIRSFSIGFLPHVLLAGVLMLLCLKQPDFGSAVMLGVLTCLLLFVAGAKLGYLLASLLLALPVAWMLVASSPYRLRRIRSFLAPFEHRYGDGYQVAESLISFGSGGMTGVGLGDSRQKLFFLPEAHTDFISAIVGEELGFVGVAAVVLAFVVLAGCGLRIALAAKDAFAALLALGLTLFLSLQALTNLAVAVALLPTKGLVLPFISYGGSALIVNCVAVGLLLSVAASITSPAGARAPARWPRPRRPRAAVARLSAGTAGHLPEGVLR